MKLSDEEKAKIVAEDRVIKAAKELAIWLKEMLQEKLFVIDELSDPELDLMSTVKELRKAEKSFKKVKKS